VGIDLLGQEDLRATGESPARQRWLPGEEAFSDWTFCYNLPLIARRAHDIRAAIQLIRQRHPRARIGVAGMNGGGPLVAAAIFRRPGEVDYIALDTKGFRFSHLTDVYHLDFLPGSVKYGDLPGLLALAAPAHLWLAGESPAGLSVVRGAYAAAGHADRLTLFAGDTSAVADSAVQWLATVGAAPK
jgi:hypothetical protein